MIQRILIFIVGLTVIEYSGMWYMLCMIGRLFCKRHTIYNIIICTHTHIYIKTIIYDREADCVLLSHFNNLKNEEITHYTSIYKIIHNREQLYIRKNKYLYQD